MPEKPDDRVRFDKWLWAARFYKTRSLAAQAIDSGQARVDERRVKPAHPVHVGASIVVRKDGLIWEVEVIVPCDKRGSASDAAALYREAEGVTALRHEEISRRKAAAISAPRPSGRPTKRDRRKLLLLRDEH
jgi:ribosome-associated heat shock protein Hsp15